MNSSHKKRKIAVAYGVVTNPDDFNMVTASLSRVGRHFDEVFVEEMSPDADQPRFLSTVSKMIRQNRVATLAIPSVSRSLFAHHGPLLKLWCLALQFKVEVKILEASNRRSAP